MCILKEKYLSYLDIGVKDRAGRFRREMLCPLNILLKGGNLPTVYP